MRQPEPRDDHSAGHPKFCLRFLDRDYNLEQLDKDQRAAFAMTLQQRGSQTWQDLARAGKHGQGSEFLPRDKFKGRIPEVFEDRDRFMVFRYSGKLPMAGVRSGDTFHIIWIERHFGELYRHG